MKLPNGYGSVYKLSGVRRRPYMVRKTVAWQVDAETGTVKQQRITIGYYETRAAALQALADYNANPYDIDTAKITFAEVFAQWSEQKYKTVSHSNVNGYNAAYKLCSSLYDMPMKDIKLKHLQAVVDTSGKNKPTLRKLKVLLSQIFDFAVINEIITRDKNIVEYVNINAAENPNSLSRSPFTVSEINTLWQAVSSNIYLQIVLMLIYSGCRISELLELKKENVHLEERYFFIAKSKTAAGVRVVPIADKVFDFWRFWYDHSACDYLLCTEDNKPINYYNYMCTFWQPLLEALNLQHHKPHDTRHTCISLLAEAHVYPTTIKKIVGHSGTQTLTEAVYTHLDLSELLDAINKI